MGQKLASGRFNPNRNKNALASADQHHSPGGSVLDFRLGTPDKKRREQEKRCMLSPVNKMADFVAGRDHRSNQQKRSNYDF